MHALLLLALAATPLPARVLPGELHTARLPNGLTVVLVPFPANGVVAFDTLVRAGAADEGKHAGVAHLLEHLVLRDAEDVRRLQALAADSNGETDHDYTLYSTVAPAESLPELMELEAARIRRPHFDAAELAAEVATIRGELALRRDDAESALERALYEKEDPAHAYGRAPIGHEADLAALDGALEAAREFHARHYGPRTTTIVLAGDFEPGRALAQLERSYGTWRAAGDPGDAPTAREKLAPARISGTVDGEPAEVRGYPLPAGRDVGALAAAEILDELVAGPVSGLALEPDERVETQLVPHRAPSLFEIFFSAVDSTRLAALERKLDVHLRQLCTGIDPERLERARSALLWNAVARLQSPAQVARAIAIHASATGRPDGIEALHAALRALDSRSLVRFAREHFGEVCAP